MRIYVYTKVLEVIKSMILVNSIFMFIVLFLSMYADDYFLFKIMICFNVLLFVLNYAIKNIVMYKVRRLYRSGKITYSEVKAVSNLMKEASIC